MAKRSDIVGIAVILLVVCLAVTMYSKSEAANLKCIIATKDGQKYCVRDREDLQSGQSYGGCE